jgi:hypothetical protein
MWVKRTPEEKDKAKKQRRSMRIRQALMIGVIVVVADLFMYSNVRSYRGPADQIIVPFDQIAPRVPGAIFMGIIAAIIMDWFSFRGRRELVCPKCGQIKYRDNNLQCSCGGHFEKREEMKWHEHEK